MDSDVPSGSSSEFTVLSTRLDNFSQLVQDFISIFATLSSIVDPDHLWQADVFLFAGSNSSCPLII